MLNREKNGLHRINVRMCSVCLTNAHLNWSKRCALERRIFFMKPIGNHAPCQPSVFIFYRSPHANWLSPLSSGPMLRIILH